MKLQTKETLKKIAIAINENWGPEAINYSDFLKLASIEAKKLNINIHPHTLKRYGKNLEEWIKFFDNDVKNEILVKEEYDDFIHDGCNNWKNIISTNNIDDIIAPEKIEVVISGKKFIYNLVIQDENSEILEEKKIWTGLFNYDDVKNIIIRRGKYTGTNIGKKSSIIKNFGSISWFYQWCHGQIERGQNINFPDTETDIETLKKIIKFIDKNMNFGN